MLACRGAPRSRAPLARCPAAPGCRLTHARAGSGGTGVAPTHARGVVQPGASAADRAGSRCGSGGVAPVGSEPVSVLTPPSTWVSELLSWVSCNATFYHGQEGILGSGGGGPWCPNPPAPLIVVVPAPQDTLPQSWWLQRRGPAILSEEGLPWHDHGSVPVADGTWPHPVHPQLTQLWFPGPP